MNRLPIYGWQSYGVGRYRHFCGACVLRTGGKWTARFVDGSSHSGLSTAKAAVTFIELNDPSFWTFDGWTSGGCIAGLWLETAFIDGDRSNRLFIASTDDGVTLAPLVERMFKKHIFWTATCARCWRPMMEFKLEPRLYFQAGFPRSRSGKGRSFLVCDCGHPVWRGNIVKLETKLLRAESSVRRHRRVKDAEGSYTPEDIKTIVSEQNGRCFYCDVLFCNETPYTIDHIESLASGGSHWPDNLCLACRNCNFSKCDRDILEFIFSLSSVKRRKALSNLARRFPFIIEALNLFGH